MIAGISRATYFLSNSSCIQFSTVFTDEGLGNIEMEMKLTLQINIGLLSVQVCLFENINMPFSRLLDQIAMCREH